MYCTAATAYRLALGSPGFVTVYRTAPVVCSGTGLPLNRFGCGNTSIAGRTFYTFVSSIFSRALHGIAVNRCFAIVACSDRISIRCFVCIFSIVWFISFYDSGTLAMAGPASCYGLTSGVVVPYGTTASDAGASDSISVSGTVVFYNTVISHRTV